MHVLDIDLDFFLADCCPLANRGERPVLQGHEPWTSEEVRRFLEEHCNLNRAKPIPGRVFDTHDGALVFWEERIREGRLTTPFSVTHIDAHSDLGIGYPGPGVVLNGVLPIQLDKRCDIQSYYARNQLDEANYLLFALAFRWVDALINVRNPRSRADFPQQLYHDESKTTIRLSSYIAGLMEGVNGREPVIPYHQYDDWKTYHATEPFDYMTLAISPRYAPKEADALVDIFRAYMVEI